MPPNNPATPGPGNGNKTSPFTPVNKAKLDRIMRLPGFKFDRKHLFLPHYRDAIHHLLGALSPTGREGRQATVLRRVIIIYRNAINTRRLYPTYDLESQGFWGAVLSDVRKEAPQIAEWLTVPVLMDVVSVYTQGYAEAKQQNDDDEDYDGDYYDSSSGEGTDINLTKTFKSSADARKILLPLVRAWAKIYRNHLARKHPKTPELTNDLVEDPAAYPPQLPGENVEDYVVRLQTKIECMDIEINSLKHEHKLADKHNEDRLDRLHATLDRTDVQLQEALAEVRLLKLGVGDGEDEPWIPWREYEAQLGIADDIEGNGPDDELEDNGDGDLQI